MEIRKLGIKWALMDDGKVVFLDRDKAAVEQEKRKYELATKKTKADLEKELEDAKNPEREALKDLSELKEDKAPEDKDDKSADLPALEDLSYADLKAIAKEQDISNYHKMKHDDLLAAVQAKIDDAKDEEVDNQDTEAPPAKGQSAGTAGPEF